MLDMPFILGFAWYIAAGLMLGHNWYGYFKEDIALNSDQTLISGIALVVTTILWPITLPFTYLELMGKYNRLLGETAPMSSDLRSQYLGPTQPSTTSQPAPNRQAQKQPRQMPRHANLRRNKIEQRLQQRDQQQ
jgi:hypothetical protein